MALYEKFGVDELLVLDPHASQSNRRRIRFQLFRVIGKCGLVRAFATEGDCVYASTL